MPSVEDTLRQITRGLEQLTTDDPSRKRSGSHLSDKHRKKTPREDSDNMSPPNTNQGQDPNPEKGQTTQESSGTLPHVTGNVPTPSGTPGGVHASVHAPQPIWIQSSDLERIMASKQRRPEIRLATPEPFDGTPTNAREFLRACKAYLRLNEHIYDSDVAKILFILSYFKKGVATDWAESWNKNVVDQPDHAWYAEFVTAFETAFISADLAAEARCKLLALRQTGSADEYNAQFQLLASQAGIKQYEGLEQLYQRGLSHKLLERIYSMNELPKDMDDWYKAASRLDNQSRRLKMVIAGLRDPILRPSRSHVVERDPDAMDIDRVSINQRDRYRREGRCFECGQKGHLFRDCPMKPPQQRNQKTGRYERNNRWDRRNIRRTEAPEAEKPKPDYGLNPQESRKRIRALLNGMDDNHREELLQELEEEGF